MKIQKDIRKNLLSCESDIVETHETRPQTIPVQLREESDTDIQQTVDDIFKEADTQMMNDEAKLAKVHPRLSRWQLKIGWSFLGFVIFTIVGLGIMGYKTYKYVENRWPGIREEAINRYEELQNELLSINDSDLTIDAYYQKQYMLVLSAEDIRDITQLGIKLEQIQQLKEIAENQESTSVSLLEILPEEKAIEFIKIMIAENRAKEQGGLVYIEDITDEDVQQFLSEMNKQQNNESD